ncbi:unnamed protein product [Darwinula stevensoni]|uniref:Uncharacterized protein n=1 Tax=Darwinula stevensoni TaxID=69355 RepID=A0A7R8XE06_9CRUS|nr:unnamed protein product [Darwinula stevensoni]CAG0894012.1 unnamed protein product [Darwinula stevensoni]
MGSNSQNESISRGVKEARCPQRDVKEMLKDTECHFTWKPDEHGHVPPESSYISKIEEKQVIHEQDNEPILMATHGLLLAYEYSRQGDLSKAHDTLQGIQSDIANMDDSTPEEIEALQYLINCSLAHVYFLMEDPDTANEILLETVKYSDSSEKVKAQILSAKADAFSVYSAESFSYALDLYREGVILDPENYTHHLGVGKMLRRIRRIESLDNVPTNEEVMALRKAVEIKRCQSSLVFLAESLREYAKAIYRKDRNLAAKLNEEALALYTEVSRDPSINANSLVRCGDGFSRLPAYMKDLDKAEECYLKALDLCPSNTTGNHKLGVFYLKQNRELAEKYLLASINPSHGNKNFSAHATYVSLKLEDDPTFDVGTEWQHMVERYPEILDQLRLHILQMQYFSQFDPEIGLHHAENTLDTLLQLKKAVQTFGCSHHLSRNGQRLKVRYPPKKFAHEHLLDGLQYLQQRLPHKCDMINSMTERLTVWMDTYALGSEGISKAPSASTST